MKRDIEEERSEERRERGSRRRIRGGDFLRLFPLSLEMLSLSKEDVGALVFFQAILTVKKFLRIH